MEADDSEVVEAESPCPLSQFAGASVVRTVGSGVRWEDARRFAGAEEMEEQSLWFAGESASGILSRNVAFPFCSWIGAGVSLSSLEDSGNGRE